MRTVRQRRGEFAEEIACEWLRRQGWQVLGRNVRVEPHDEIDLVAIDPAAPGVAVCVEVRSARSREFGSPEERVSARKIGSLYRAAQAFSRSERASQLGVGRLKVRVDLLVVDLRGTTPRIRHLKALEPA
ncbi:MAG TPA: YraN family protein [Candidatus Limnocylindrales bacterium]|jgi:putative endonuclease